MTALGFIAQSWQSSTRLLLGKRRAFVKHLESDIVLSPYSVSARARFERADDQRQIDEAFTNTMVGFFRVFESQETENIYDRIPHSSSTATNQSPLRFNRPHTESPMAGPH